MSLTVSQSNICETVTLWYRFLTRHKHETRIDIRSSRLSTEPNGLPLRGLESLLLSSPCIPRNGLELIQTSSNALLNQNWFLMLTVTGSRDICLSVHLLTTTATLVGGS